MIIKVKKKNTSLEITRNNGSGVEPVKVMKICGWKDLKTLAIYLRLAGVDEKGGD